MISWANDLPVQRVDLDRSSPEQLGAYVAAFEDRGLEARCSLVTVDLGVPVIVAMVRSRHAGDPAMVVSAAADLDVAAACRRALSELTANRLNVRHSMEQAGPGRRSWDPRQVRDETAHGLLYADPEAAGPLEQWWEPKETVPLRPVRQKRAVWARLTELTRSVTRAGLDALVVDLTPPEIAALGLRTVKVLVPGTYPMNFDSLWPQFGGARMASAPVAAGLLDEPVSFEALNRVPHPFP